MQFSQIGGYKLFQTEEKTSALKLCFLTESLRAETISIFCRVNSKGQGHVENRNCNQKHGSLE
jgi:hypothetical protein